MGAVERRTASFSHSGRRRSICYARPSVRSIDGAVPGTVRCREVLTRYQQAGVARQAMLHGKAETKGLLGFLRDPRLQVSGPRLDRFVCPNIRSSARTTSPTSAASPRSWSR